jgi:DNA-binding MarR family transcriptional regulator
MADLSAEIQLNRGFRSLEEEAMLNVWRTADRLEIHFTRLFREHGVTVQQYNVLRILRGAAGPLPCLEVASRMITMVPAITGLLDRLEAAAWVERTRSTTDRRVFNVALTPQGRRLLRSLDAPVDALHKELLGHMPPDALRQLIALATQAREAADAREA